MFLQEQIKTSSSSANLSSLRFPQPSARRRRARPGDLAIVLCQPHSSGRIVQVDRYSHCLSLGLALTACRLFCRVQFDLHSSALHSVDRGYFALCPHLHRLLLVHRGNLLLKLKGKRLPGLAGLQYMRPMCAPTIRAFLDSM